MSKGGQKGAAAKGAAPGASAGGGTGGNIPDVVIAKLLDRKNFSFYKGNKPEKFSVIKILFR